MGANSGAADRLLDGLSRVRLDYDLASLLDFVPRPRRVATAIAAPVLPAAQPFRGADARSGAALECLTAAVYYEARSESPEGQRAVAQVVLNRARHSAYPSTICGVVFQGAHLRTGCQFSFTCDGSMRRRREEHAWRAAQAVAEAALQGHVEARVGLATHYHTHAVNPTWASSLDRLASLGSHVFYNWRGSAGAPSAFRDRSTLARPEPAQMPTRRTQRAQAEPAPAPAPKTTALSPEQAESGPAISAQTPADKEIGVNPDALAADFSFVAPGFDLPSVD